MEEDFSNKDVSGQTEADYTDHFIEASNNERDEKYSPREEKQALSDHEKAEVFQNAIEEGINDALALIKERFEDSLEEKDRLEFHNRKHTEGVVRRATAILDTIREIDPSLVSDRAYNVGRFTAAYHDTTQKWEPQVIPSTTPGEEGLFKIMRKRFGGQNEEESTQDAIDAMDKVNKGAGTEIFTDDDKTMVRAGHEATIPGFNPEIGTVVQTKLNKESSIITRATALGDLGTAGMDGPEEFLAEGDALFREENLDIADAMNNRDSLSPQYKEFCRKRMLGWSQFQEKFASGRKTLLDEELRPLPDHVREQVKEKHFNKFDASIAAAVERAQKRAGMSFEEIAEDMGYELGDTTKVVY